jgi:hypothetical protein
MWIREGLGKPISGGGGEGEIWTLRGFGGEAG